MTITERNKKYYVPPALYVRILKVPPLLAGSPDGTTTTVDDPESDDTIKEEDFSAKSSFFSFGYDDMNSDEQY